MTIQKSDPSFQSGPDLLAWNGHRIAVARDAKRWREDERAGSPEVVVATVSEPHVESRLIDWMSSPFAAEEFLGRVDALVRVRRVVMHQSHDLAAGGDAAARRGRWGAVTKRSNSRGPTLP